MITRSISWFTSHLPTKESIASNRWTRPFAKYLLRPDLWRLNRRSVPRAVALGLFVGPIVPVAHTLVVALLAVPTRANIVVAAAVTWMISNPITWIPMYDAAYKIGKWLLKLDQIAPVSVTNTEVTHQATEWLSWVYDKSGPAALGTFVLATVIASIGYLLSSLVWSLWIARKWRSRRAQ
jgi:uncharacterized protein